MSEFLQPVLLSGAASSYLAALLNQPKFPRWLRLVIVFVLCLGAAYYQHLQHPQDGVDLTMRIAFVFGSALLLYNNALKHLGGEWLTNNVTPEAIRDLLRVMVGMPAEGASASARLKALETLKADLTEEEYTAKRAAILGEV